MLPIHLATVHIHRIRNPQEVSSEILSGVFVSPRPRMHPLRAFIVPQSPKGRHINSNRNLAISEISLLSVYSPIK